MVAAFSDTFMSWAGSQPGIAAVVLIGSHVRPLGSVNAADPASDWDFQVITRAPEIFRSAEWTRELSGTEVLAYSVRPAFGGVQKITALFSGAEADFVVLSHAQLTLARWATRLGLHRRPGRLRRGLADLAVVIRPGYRFLKGEAVWAPFYRQVVQDVADPRLDDAGARLLADGFVCDLVWTQRKLQRGELLAAQRMLHHSLAETNFRLLHELRLRRGEASYPEARRLEITAGEAELAAVSISAPLHRDALMAAAQQSRESLVALMHQLVPAWRWPESVERTLHAASQD